MAMPTATYDTRDAHLASGFVETRVGRRARSRRKQNVSRTALRLIVCGSKPLSIGGISLHNHTNEGISLCGVSINEQRGKVIASHVVFS